VRRSPSGVSSQRTPLNGRCEERDVSTRNPTTPDGWSALPNDAESIRHHRQTPLQDQRASARIRSAIADRASSLSERPPLPRSAQWSAMKLTHRSSQRRARRLKTSWRAVSRHEAESEHPWTDLLRARRGCASALRARRCLDEPLQLSRLNRRSDRRTHNKLAQIQSFADGPGGGRCHPVTSLPIST
jgi:hypothetical protein